jgi:hypothetical protein
VVTDKNAATNHGLPKAGLGWHKMNRLLWFASVLTCIFSLTGSVARAEEPSWDNIAAPLYVIVPHSWTTPGTLLTTRQGIWRFDPTTRSYTRLRPFYYNASCWGPPCGRGQGSNLTAFDDRLLFQAGPGYIEFDPVTGRVLHRYDGLSDPAYRGWALQGPALGSAVAADVGLAPGVYALPECWFYWLATEFPPQCPHVVFPGASQAEAYWRSALWFRRPLYADQGQLQAFADLHNSPEEVAVHSASIANGLSFDPIRKGFWLGDTASVSFLPLTETGNVDLAGTVRRPVPPTVLASGQVHRLFFYDPKTDHFFAVRSHPNQTPSDPTFLELDHDLNVVAVLGVEHSLQTGPYDPVPWTLARLPDSPPTEYVQTIPVVAHTPGRNGTFWTADLWLYNPSPQPTTVSIRRVAAPEAPEATINLGGHASVRIQDVLTWIGGGPSGDGVTHDALVLTSPYRLGEQLVACARSFTPSADPVERAAGGTMGQAVVAVPGRTGYSTHLQDVTTANLERFTGRLAQLVLDRRDPTRFRHNLGVVNDADTPLTVTLWWGFCEDNVAGWPFPPPGGRQDITVPPHRVEVLQIEPLFPESVRDSVPAKIAVTADRAAILSLSMVDNRTGDATWVPFTHFWLDGGEDTRMAIPAVAHNQGEKGTVWRTDVYATAADIHNGTDALPSQLDDLKAYFHPAWPATSCGGAAQGGEISGSIRGVPPLPSDVHLASLYGWRSIFPDVIHMFAPCVADEGVRGALEIRTGSWMAAYARNYTVRADGGTYGEILPLYPEHGWPVQHFAGIEIAPQFRVDLGLYNGDPNHAITHRLSLYAADGTLVAERELTLQPWENLIDRLERLLGLEVGSLPVGTYGLTVLPLDDPANGVEGRSWAFVSLVDNVTGDPAQWW